MSKRTADEMLEKGRSLNKEFIETLTREKTVQEERKKIKKDLLKIDVWAVRVTCKHYSIPTSYYRSKKDAETAVKILTERFLRREDEKGRYIFEVSKATEDEYENILKKGFSEEEEESAYNQSQAFVIYTDEKKESIEHIVLMPGRGVSPNLFEVTPIIDPHKNRITWAHNFIYVEQHYATEKEFYGRLKMILNK